MTARKADSRTGVPSAPVIVQMPPLIDAGNADRVCEQLSATLVTTGSTPVIADLSATAFCDAAGAHRLGLIGRQAAARDGRLRLVIPHGAVLRPMLVLLGVDHLLPVYTSLAEALSVPGRTSQPYV